MSEENFNRVEPAVSDDVACDPSLTRAEFIRRVVKGAAVTGGLLAAPAILDKFLVPPAYAAGSPCFATLGGTVASNGAPDCTVSVSPVKITCGTCILSTDTAPGNITTCQGARDFEGC